MTHPRARTPEHPARRAAHQAVLATTFLLMLAAVSVSTGLVVRTAWLHDLENGPFAIIIALLSARVALSWFRWLDSYQPFSRQPSAVSHRQGREGRKPADEATP